MKKYRLHVLTMAVLLCLVSGLVLAQDVPAFDYSKDRQQYEGQDVPAAQEPVSSFAPPTEALIPCPADPTETTVCDMLATQPEDIVGVWTLYFQSHPAFIRFNPDGTWMLGNSVESTSDMNSAYASGPYHVDDNDVFTLVSPGIPVDIVPEECQAGRYLMRVIKIGGQPAALNLAVIEDCFVNRRTDWGYTMLWAGGE